MVNCGLDRDELGMDFEWASDKLETLLGLTWNDLGINKREFLMNYEQTWNGCKVTYTWMH